MKYLRTTLSFLFFLSFHTFISSQNNFEWEVIKFQEEYIENDCTKFGYITAINKEEFIASSNTTSYRFTNGVWDPNQMAGAIMLDSIIYQPGISRILQSKDYGRNFETLIIDPDLLPIFKFQKLNNRLYLIGTTYFIPFVSEVKNTLFWSDDLGLTWDSLELSATANLIFHGYFQQGLPSPIVTSFLIDNHIALRYLSSSTPDAWFDNQSFHVIDLVSNTETKVLEDLTNSTTFGNKIMEVSHDGKYTYLVMREIDGLDKFILVDNTDFSYMEVEINFSAKQIVSRPNEPLIILGKDRFLISYDNGKNWELIIPEVESTCDPEFIDIDISSDSYIFITQKDGVILRSSKIDSLTSSVMNNSLTDINIWPNPAFTEINIEFESLIDFRQIEIYNNKGVLVLQSIESELNSPISIKNLDSGLYVVIIKSVNGYVSKKFIKI